MKIHKLYQKQAKKNKYSGKYYIYSIVILFCGISTTVGASESKVIASASGLIKKPIEMQDLAGKINKKDKSNVLPSLPNVSLPIGQRESEPKKKKENKEDPHPKQKWKDDSQHTFEEG